VNNQLTTGFDLDRVALDSAAGGAAAAPVSASAIAAPPAEPTTTVDVTSKTATAMHLRVSKATAPFELIMGQSINSGWAAQLTGAGSLGKPVLIDGFANGWKVTGADLVKAGSSGSFDVTLRWTPQSRVNVGLIVSALTILLCLLLAYLPERVRRRIYVRMVRTLRWPWRPSRKAVAHAGTERGDTTAWAGDVPAPRLWSPFRPGRPRVSWPVSLGAAIATGLVGGLIARPLTGLIVGVATLISLLVPRVRVVLGLAAIGLLVAAGTYTVVEQSHLGDAAVGGGWATYFGAASNLAWAAVVFLGADAVVELVSRLVSTRSSARGPKRPRGAHTRRPGPGVGPVDPSDSPRAPIPSGTGPASRSIGLSD
jgi:hypothetical protein